MAQPNDYEARLARARRAVEAARGIKLPTDLGDQLDAATRETQAHQDRLGKVLQFIEPDRDWRAVKGIKGPLFDEATARQLAAIVGFQLCTHLRQTPAQPVIARMPLRRLDCQRCILTVVRPPSDEGDRCDWCGRRGVTNFWPMSINIGYMQAIEQP